MAEAANTTIVRFPHPNDAAIGQAARDWEADLCDLCDLAEVAGDLLDAYTGKPVNECHSFSM